MRSCWNHEEINILRSRMIMQDLIPNKVPRDIPYLIEYLRSTEEAVVRHSPEGKVRRIMMLALSDVLGGYLQAVVIPLAKESYYAGNIDYATMARLYEMLHEMRSRLRTNGGRWSRPLDMSQFSVKVTALNLPMTNSELACKAIILIPTDMCPAGQPRIAIPYLDYDTKPGAVALPLKARNLYSLRTAASSHIIVRFYILARQCLGNMPPQDTELFNSHFMRWLSLHVIPHLYEDEWYPGFGSIMRIVETVNDSAITYQLHPVYVANDTSLEKSLLNSNICGFFGRLKSLAKYNLAWLILFILSALLLIFCCCCCCWCTLVYWRGGGYGYLGKKSSSGILNAVLSIYCGLKEKESYKEEPLKSTMVSQHYESSDVRPSYMRTSRPSRPSAVDHSQPEYPQYQGYPRYPSSVTSEMSSSIPSSSEDEESTTST